MMDKKLVHVCGALFWYRQKQVLVTDMYGLSNCSNVMIYVSELCVRSLWRILLGYEKLFYVLCWVAEEGEEKRNIYGTRVGFLPNFDRDACTVLNVPIS